MSRQTIHCLSRLAPSNAIHPPPTFLAPALDIPYRSCLAPASRPFSTSSSLAKSRRKSGNKISKDNNRQRGVSAIRHTGPRWKLQMQKYELPQPVENPESRKLFDKDPAVQKHGLWKFFNEDRKAMTTPVELASHGRAWTYQELSTKDWSDLHRLWWLCSLERNRIATSDLERARVKAGFGQWEAKSRDDTIKETQKQIKRVLRDRHIAWEEARSLLNSGFKPDDDPFLEEEEFEEVEQRSSEGTEPDAHQIVTLPSPQALPSSDAPASRPVA